jgi:hypothetical protein
VPCRDPAGSDGSVGSLARLRIEPDPFAICGYVEWNKSRLAQCQAHDRPSSSPDSASSSWAGTLGSSSRRHDRRLTRAAFSAVTMMHLLT